MVTREMTLGEEIIGLTTKGIDISTVERMYKKYINVVANEEPKILTNDNWLEQAFDSVRMCGLRFGSGAEDFILQHIKVGDQIEIELSRLVGFPATVHKVTEDKIMIIFDDYVAAKPMNESDTNDGGFEKSDLYKWLHTDFVKLLPASLRERIIDVTIPSVGEMFSWGDKWNREHFEPDGDEQLPLMVYRRNRVAYFDNEISRGWLRNAIKKECSSAGFAFVGDGGNLGYRYASRSYGVRPVIWLVK
jgi:hypothetical protein|nr:MAG TPA: hypothetical protein [Caudoviricetes sp.]